MLVCGLDFETTGLNTEVDRITEIGAVLFDTDDNWKPLASWNSLVWDESYPKQTEDVIKVTGITDEMLRTDGISPEKAIANLDAFARDAECFVAHNAPFDESFYAAEFKRQGFEKEKRQFVCSMTDLKTNQQFKSWRLAHLALEYMVPVDPRVLHRASDDVALMGQMLMAAKADIHEMIKYKNTPEIVIRAMVPKPWDDGGKGKDAAKALGYSWQTPKNSTKTYKDSWVKTIKEDEFEIEVEKAKGSFSIKQL